MMLTTEGRIEERAGGEKTHWKTFAGRVVVKIRMIGLERRNRFGTKFADGWDGTGTGKRSKT